MPCSGQATEDTKVNQIDMVSAIMELSREDGHVIGVEVW